MQPSSDLTVHHCACSETSLRKGSCTPHSRRYVNIWQSGGVLSMCTDVVSTFERTFRIRQS